MPNPDEMHLQTLADLEREVRRRYGRAAESMLMGLPLDFDRRVAALRRMLGTDPTDLGASATDGGE